MTRRKSSRRRRKRKSKSARRKRVTPKLRKTTPRASPGLPVSRRSGRP